MVYIHWVREIIAPGCVASIRRLGRHDTDGDPTPELIFRRYNSGESMRSVSPGTPPRRLMKNGAPVSGSSGIRRYARCEKKNVAEMRLGEVVSELVDKDLIPGIDGATRNDIAAI